MDGFINLNKPLGMTSNAAVLKARGILGEKKIGHLGTLDPQAEGVLPLAIGKAAKLFNYLINKQKKYVAEFTFGKTTDTLDGEGAVTETRGFNASEEEVKNAVKKFTGRFAQIPPRYSAKNVNGVRAYDLARKGKEFELQPKTVEVFEFRLLRRVSETAFSFEIVCSAGTYIRSLARDLAAELNTVAYMSALIRTRAGMFFLSGAITPEQLKAEGSAAVLPIDYAISDLEAWDVNAGMFKKLENGVKINWEPETDGYRRITCGGVLFGVGKNTGGKLDLEFYLR